MIPATDAEAAVLTEEADVLVLPLVLLRLGDADEGAKANKQLAGVEKLYGTVEIVAWPGGIAF